MLGFLRRTDEGGNATVHAVALRRMQRRYGAWVLAVALWRKVWGSIYLPGPLLEPVLPTQMWRSQRLPE